MERTDVGCRLAEVRQRHLVGAAILGGEREARTQWNLPADDAMSTHEVQRHVEQVHRAALALRASRRLAEQFRHDRSRCHAARQRLSVLAVGADYVVVGTKCGECANRHGFLPDIQVAEAADLSKRICLTSLLLEVPDQHHVVQPFAVLIREWRIGAFALGASGGLRHFHDSFLIDITPPPIAPAPRRDTTSESAVTIARA